MGQRQGWILGSPRVTRFPQPVRGSFFWQYLASLVNERAAEDRLVIEDDSLILTEVYSQKSQKKGQEGRGPGRGKRARGDPAPPGLPSGLLSRFFVNIFL